MKHRQLKQIRTLGTEQYEVTIGSGSSDENDRKFAFRIDGTDIQVVVWTNEFAEYMDNDMITPRRLFEAVLRFHEARAVTFP